MKACCGLLLVAVALLSGCGDEETNGSRARDAAADRPTLDGSKSDTPTGDAAVDTSAAGDGGGGGGMAGDGGGGTAGVDMDGSIDSAVAGSAGVDASTGGRFTVGGTISGLSGTVVLQNNGTDNLSCSTNSAFTFATALADRGPYDVSVLTQPSGQSCAVTNGSGTISGSNVTNVLVSCANVAPPRFAYVANADSNSISMYTIDALTGQLRHNGYVLAGKGPYSVTLDPSSKYAYVANFAGSTISQFTIGTNGVLSAMAPDSVAAGQALSVTVDPSGRFAYAANYHVSTVSQYYGESTVSQYTIGVNGALTPMTPATVATGRTPNSIAVDPSGRYAYVPHYESTTVSQYAIGTNGALTAMTPGSVAAGKDPYSVAFDPAGKYAYVTNPGSNDVSQFTIGPTGALRAMTPGSIASQSYPIGIAVDPTGKYAYVANHAASTISQYSIGTDGTLTAMTPPTIATGLWPYSISVDPSGKFVYVTNYLGDSVSRYTIGPRGALAAASATPAITTHDSPSSIVIAKGAAPVTYTPKFAFGFQQNGVATLRIDPSTGALTQVGAVAPAPPGSAPVALALHPSGRFAYVANGLSDNVTTFSIDAATGALTRVGTEVAAGDFPSLIAVEPSGRFAYVLNKNSHDLMTFSIDAATGVLTAAGNQPVGDDAVSFTVDPAGRFAYVTTLDQGIGTVLEFAIIPSGLSSAIGRTVTTNRPTSMTVDPSGRFAYVTVDGNFSTVGTERRWNRGDVVLFGIEPNLGTLTSLAALGKSWDLPSTLSVHPSGRFAYLTNEGQYDRTRGDFDNLGSGTALSIDQTSGALTDMMPTPFTLRAPGAFSVDPSGRFAYVTDGTNVAQFGINQTTGALTPARSTAGIYPLAILAVVQ